MKKTGIVLLIAGLLITIFTSFNFVTKEKVVDIGKLEISRDKGHEISWSPILGVAVMVAGGCLFFFGSRRK